MVEVSDTSLCWAYHGQDDVGGMRAVVQDLLMGHPQLGVGAEGVAGVGVAVPAREATGGHLQPDAVARLEDVAGSPQVDHIFVRRPRLDRGWRLALREAAVA